MTDNSKALVCTSGIRNEFCVYIVHSARLINLTLNYEISEQPVYINQKSIFRAEVDFALRRQYEIMREFKYSVFDFIKFYNTLIERKLLPEQFKFHKVSLKSFKKPVNTIRIYNHRESAKYKNTHILKYTFKQTVVSYLSQKQIEIMDCLIMSDKIQFQRLLQVLIQLMDFDDKAISFKESVDQLYNKSIHYLYDEEKVDKNGTK